MKNDLEIKELRAGTKTDDDKSGASAWSISSRVSESEPLDDLLW